MRGWSGGVECKLGRCIPRNPRHSAEVEIDCDLQAHTKLAPEPDASHPDFRDDRCYPAGGLYKQRNRVSEYESAQSHQKERLIPFGRGGFKLL
jgi:hypothetical protein